MNSKHDDDFRQDLLTKTKWLCLITVSRLLEHSLLVSVRRSSSERECLGQGMPVVFSASLWAIKQAAWQPCLPRQVNKQQQPWGQQPASIIALKAARKTWRLLEKHSRNKALNYLLLLPLQKKLIWRQRSERSSPRFNTHMTRQPPHVCCDMAHISTRGRQKTTSKDMWCEWNHAA